MSLVPFILELGPVFSSASLSGLDSFEDHSAVSVRLSIWVMFLDDALTVADYWVACEV